MKTLSDVDIRHMCNKYNIKLNGIYNRDNLPNLLAQGYYILNLDLSKNDGTHWTAFYIGKSDEINIYFDSFGFEPPEELDKKLKTYIYNSKEIQDVRSSSCGWLSLFFIFFLQSNPRNEVQNFEKFESLWSSNTTQNENLLQDFWDDI